MLIIPDPIRAGFNPRAPAWEAGSFTRTLKTVATSVSPKSASLDQFLLRPSSDGLNRRRFPCQRRQSPRAKSTYDIIAKNQWQFEGVYQPEQIFLQSSLCSRHCPEGKSTREVADHLRDSSVVGRESAVPWASAGLQEI
ncbi:uncharacterized protein LOC143729680 [Siphateles boraxobius]|uniref:uncharacterized protein LOC143729680 n=1 Tax=Siphateles boraxobius TaxID=180520 RepID=UPI0040627BD1